MNKRLSRTFSVTLILALMMSMLSVASPALANNTAQTLPFSQDWSNTGLITISDDWSGVSGIIGYRGDNLASTGTDPQTILADGSGVVDVNTNQTAPNTFTTGGVSEFEITDPVIALQGSGTADAPHIVIYLNTTGQSGINISYNVRDIDGSADNAAQQVALQYRVGNSGNFINVPAGYIADATLGGAATLVTPINVALPAAVDNQPNIQIRIITADAAGSDEWVGIDDIAVTVAGGITDPSGVGVANPATVAPGDPALLTVNVTPGANPASTGLTVTCDLSSIGGNGTQAFLDDGLNGDVTAGDNIFSFSATVDSGTSEGIKSLACAITDAEARSGNTSIALTVQEPIAIVINEILADPDPAGGDANGDGVVNIEDDEFVEIVNNESSNLDISGWTLNDGIGVRHTFPANTVIPASCSIVVFAGGTPTGVFGHSLVQVATGGQLGLNNPGDTVTLNNGTSNVVTYTYGSAGGDNQSLTRDPDVTGSEPLVKHTTATGSGGALQSPGTKVNGDQFAGCPAEKKIHEVQGSGSASPLVGQTVIIEGIVVGDFQDGASGVNGDLNGFHIQEEDADADADPLTSEGIFVFNGSSPSVNVALGDHVRVQGSVSEFNGLTEITSFTGVTVLSTGNPLPTPIGLTLPATNVSSFEAFEGMRVTFAQALYISEYFNYGRYGEIVLTSERHLTPTAEFEPGAPAIQAAQDFLLDKITLDDGRTTQNPDPAIHPDGGVFDLSNLFRGGDTVANVTGVMDYSFSLYRIHPTQGADYVSVNPRTAQPADVGGDLKVASFNVLNYFTTLTSSGAICGPSQNQDCRGADTAAEFTRQRDKIITAITAIDADVVGLLEIENNVNDNAVEDLVNGLNAVNGAGTYAYVNTGVIGTDAIKVALIYKPAQVSLVGGYAILDSSVDVRFIDTRNRPALAQTFMDSSTGGVFTVAVNHLKSKGSACTGDPDLGDGAGNCNLTRKAAAEALVDWLASDPTVSGDSDFLIIGDLNAYDKEDPIDAIKAGSDDTAGTSDDYTDLVFQFQGEDAYSYVFDGQLGYLDHALASSSLVSQITGVADWHINADEPNLIDYDMTFKLDPQDAIYASDAYRSSDHDPVVIGLSLTVPDTTEPDTAIDSAPSNPSNNSSPSFTFSGTDNAGGSGVAGFECDLDSGGFSACTSPQSYSGLADGSHTFQVRAIDGANNIDPTPASFTWVIDATAPLVTINQAAGQADPTNSGPINFEVVFSEAVTGFDNSDVTINSTAGVTTAVVTGGPTTYNVAVSGMTGNGTVTVAIPVNAASDAAGNGNSASTSTDNTVTFIASAPIPTCNGQTATIYVNADGKIVGGPQNGQTYNGNLLGTNGDDVIVGTDGQNTIFALGGNDIVCALDGHDTVFGGTGNDTIYAGVGNDAVFGGFGDDTIEAAEGNDIIRGEYGNDVLNGGSGGDICNGGAGFDTSSSCEIKVLIP